ncbi:hypothetical protein GQR36_24135 [Enterococcus termitis]
MIVTLILPLFLNLVPMKAEAAGRDISQSHITSITTNSSNVNSGEQISIEVLFDNSAGEIENGDYLALSWSNRVDDS